MSGDREVIAQVIKDVSIKWGGPSMAEFADTPPLRKHYATADAIIAKGFSRDDYVRADCWLMVADHEAFDECRESDLPLIDAVLNRITELHDIASFGRTHETGNERTCAICGRTDIVANDMPFDDNGTAWDGGGGLVICTRCDPTKPQDEPSDVQVDEIVERVYDEHKPHIAGMAKALVRAGWGAALRVAAGVAR